MFELGPDNIKMRQYIYSFLDLAGAKAIIGIGCGYGYDLLQLGKMASINTRLYGIDRSEKAIEETNRTISADPRYSASVVDADARLPFGNESIDIVFSLNFLECIRSKDKLL